MTNILTNDSQKRRQCFNLESHTQIKMHFIITCMNCIEQIHWIAILRLIFHLRRLLSVCKILILKWNQLSSYVIRAIANSQYHPQFSYILCVCVRERLWLSVDITQHSIMRSHLIIHTKTSLSNNSDCYFNNAPMPRDQVSRLLKKIQCSYIEIESSIIGSIDESKPKCSQYLCMPKWLTNNWLKCWKM